MITLESMAVKWRPWLESGGLVLVAHFAVALAWLQISEKHFTGSPADLITPAIFGIYFLLGFLAPLSWLAIAAAPLLVLSQLPGEYRGLADCGSLEACSWAEFGIAWVWIMALLALGACAAGALCRYGWQKVRKSRRLDEPTGKAPQSE